MSQKKRKTKKPRTSRPRERHLSVRAEFRDKPNVELLARAIVSMAALRIQHQSREADDSKS